MGVLRNEQAFTAENRRFPLGSREIYIAEMAGIRKALLTNIATLVEKSIAAGYYPGMVILAAHRGQLIYRGVFGNQSLVPEVIGMRTDTIFDLASLTKVIVTTTAVMQLLEAGRLDLDSCVSQYWPEFAFNGKDRITVRELLTHTSGLQAIPPPWTAPVEENQRYATGLKQIEQLSLVEVPGKIFVYSDTNFIILGYLAELISGERLDQYAQTHIFQPLQMNSAVFLPPPEMRDRIAPTVSPEDQQPRWARVNDPTTERMNGVSGVAGLFANAHDVGIFLECLLNGGRITGERQPFPLSTAAMASCLYPALGGADARNEGGDAPLSPPCDPPSHKESSLQRELLGERYLLSPLTIRKMTTPQTPPGMPDCRGLGWDLDSAYSNRGVLFPVGSFGHTGWTGVSVWADPATHTWIVALTSRSHPALAPANQLIKDRRAIANIVAASLTDIDASHWINTGAGESYRAFHKPA